MKELNRTDRLTIAAILFAVLLILGFITLKEPEISYTLSSTEMLNRAVSFDDLITPEEVQDIVKNKDNRYLLADIRMPAEFHTSHIGEARNIPVQEILEKDYLEFFEDLSRSGIIVILYGNDQQDANGAWMILNQVGIDNLRVMEGGFDFYSKMPVSGTSVSAEKEYQAEKAVYNYKEIMESLGSPSSLSSPASAPEPVRVIRKEKKSAAEGGC